MPITAACATAGWPIAAPSIAALLIHSPPDLMTSLERSTMLHRAIGIEPRHVAGLQPALGVIAASCLR